MKNQALDFCPVEGKRRGVGWLALSCLPLVKYKACSVPTEGYGKNPTAFMSDSHLGSEVQQARDCLGSLVLSMPGLERTTGDPQEGTVGTGPHSVGEGFKQGGGD